MTDSASHQYIFSIDCHKQTVSLSGYRHKLIAICLVLLSVFPPTGWSNTIQGGIQYTLDSYRVGPGDVLSVHIYNQPDLSQADILVREDGNASFHGVGQLFVSGKTLDEINQQLRVQLEELIVDPIVTISVTQTKAGVVYLAGAVKNPGMYQLTTNQSKANTSQAQPIARLDLRLSNILANAGGVMMNADLSRVEIRHGSSGQTTRVNLWNMLKEASGEEDILVQSGDSIVVPELPQTAVNDEDYNLLLRSSIGPGSFPVRVIGEVTTPGIYQLAGGSPFLNSAIAQAGGYKPGANTKMLAIRRFTGKDVSTLYVDPSQADTVLRPNDVVFISEQKVYKAGRFLETVAKVFSPFSGMASIALPFVWAKNAE